MSSRNEAFSFLIYLDAAKFVLLTFFTFIETICLKIWAMPKNARGPLLVDVGHPKTSLQGSKLQLTGYKCD